ncbi:hypothetical protein [Nocardiopsis alkaliphila]|uniref:hypothetical protein n=1 Tax=Nocardiopsis alkaliphila TaxID=225762 RepID=UPI000348E809|nr:hypothetical protein [Nocardiopsis alkaliphila]
MGVTTKLGLYAAGLVVVFAAAFGVGSMIGPVLPKEDGHGQSVERSSEDTRDQHDVEED